MNIILNPSASSDEEKPFKVVSEIALMQLEELYILMNMFPEAG